MRRDPHSPAVSRGYLYLLIEVRKLACALGCLHDGFRVGRGPEEGAVDVANPGLHLHLLHLRHCEPRELGIRRRSRVVPGGRRRLRGGVHGRSGLGRSQRRGAAAWLRSRELRPAVSAADSVLRACPGSGSRLLRCCDDGPLVEQSCDATRRVSPTNDSLSRPSHRPELCYPARMPHQTHDGAAATHSTATRRTADLRQRFCLAAGGSRRLAFARVLATKRKGRRRATWEVQRERVGDGCHGWSAQGALSRPVLPSRRHRGVGRASAPLPARGFAAQVLYHYLGGVSLIHI